MAITTPEAFTTFKREFQGEQKCLHDVTRDERVYLDELLFSAHSEAEIMDIEIDKSETWREEYITSTGRHIYIIYEFPADVVPVDEDTEERLSDDGLLPWNDSDYITAWCAYTDDDRENIPLLIANGLQIAQKYKVDVQIYEDTDRDEIGIKITNAFLADATAAAKAITSHAYGRDTWTRSITNGIIVYC